MCLHGSLSVLSPSQLLPGIVGPEPQGEWGGFAGDAQGGAIHARCVEAHVCERDRLAKSYLEITGIFLGGGIMGSYFLFYTIFSNLSYQSTYVILQPDENEHYFHV